MINIIKKNIILILPIILVIYFSLNLLGGNRGLFAYIDKKDQFEINKKNVNHYFRLHLNRGLSFLMSSQSKSLADYCKEFIK